MPQLVSRILLGALLPPLAVVFDIVGHVMADRRLPDFDAYWISNLSTAVFVAVYWFLLWRRLVTWTAWRVVLTIAVVAPALIVGMITMQYVEDNLWPPIGIMAGMIATMLLWMFATAFIWRQTAGERPAALSGG
jgi:hypothetical protein